MGDLGRSLFHTGAGEAAAPHRILVVDDEPRLRHSLRLLLEADGRELRECGSGAEAFACMETQGVDLILLDLRLPDVTGMDILDWVARNQIGATVIVVSGDAGIDAAIGALRRGAYDFVRKPYQAEEIRRTVDNALQRRGLERTNALITARLEQSERLHRYLVESSPDIVYTLDARGRFAFINRRVEALLGHGREALLGRHYSEIVHEEDRERARFAFDERRTGVRAASNVELRLACRLPGDGYRDFENRFRVISLSAMGIYSEDEEESGERFLGTYGVARDITERKKAEETISFQAYHDLLTLLPNRNLFKDRLGLAMAQARRHGCLVAVMFIDLDRFKLVNDTFGHAEGDELLKALAARLKHCLRAGDTLARQGGDEFTVLLPDLLHAGDAALIAQKILDELKRPFTVGGQDFRATVSIGIALYPRDGESAEALIKHADIAMYHVKTRGKNGFQVFSPEMNRVFHQKLALENDLRRALQRDEFELHYQPQISTGRRRIVGMEALIRWRHPDHGLLNPASFVSLAEEAGLICAVSDWVLDAACAQLRRWRELAGGGARELRMSINLSPHEFERDGLVERVVRCTAAHGLPAHALEIEITETLLLQDAEGVIEKVRRLRERGVRVSIDDFGTRYSSLNYLQRFPVSSIKIDQSFVADLRGGAHSPIIVAIMAIARGFGLHPLAEGVESVEQMQALRALGCDEMQGYLFGAPMTVEQAGEYLRSGPAMPPVE